MRSALAAIATDGIGGVTIDRLARELRATRGSFYWHFRDRDELVVAAIELWARESTEERLPELEAIGDPLLRLRALVRSVYEVPADPVEVALSASASDPRVASTLAHVVARRLSVVRRIFVDLGFSPRDASDRAWLTYAFYIGHHQLLVNEEIAARRPPRLQRLVTVLSGRGADRVGLGRGKDGR
jgi:AcrR family transcriptional regulator